MIYMIQFKYIYLLYEPSMLTKSTENTAIQQALQKQMAEIEQISQKYQSIVLEDYIKPSFTLNTDRETAVATKVTNPVGCFYSHFIIPHTVHKIKQLPEKGTGDDDVQSLHNCDDSNQYHHSTTEETVNINL